MDHELYQRIDALDQHQSEICDQLRELRDQVTEMRDAVLAAVSTAQRSEGVARQAFIDVVELRASEQQARRKLSEYSTSLRSDIHEVDAASKARDTAHDASIEGQAATAALSPKVRSVRFVVGLAVFNAVLAIVVALVSLWIWGPR